MAIDRKEITLIVEKLLKQACSDDYIGTVTREIIDDVIEDVEVSADVNYSEDDVRLAIGRVLIDRIGAKQ